MHIMGVGRGAGEGQGTPWILKILAKKGCFLSFAREKTNCTMLPPPIKF